MSARRDRDIAVEAAREAGECQVHGIARCTICVAPLQPNWVPIQEYDWDGNFNGGLKSITCRNHPTARYSSKHPGTRSLHFLQAPEGFGYFTECPCPYADLVVIVGEEE